MRIGAFLHQSFIDWDGRAAAVVFLRGCNFRCRYCHNPSLVIPELMAPEEDVPYENVMDFLRSRSEWLDGVVITGGEPTIHKELPEFLREIKGLGLAVKLDTNGTNPYMVEELIRDRLVDCIAMDVKTIPSVAFYEEISGNILPLHIWLIKRTVEVLQASSMEVCFRMTVIPGIHTEEIISRVRKLLEPKTLSLQEFRNSVTVNDYL